ncbi:MAG TPA: hypothetical protein VE173_10645, partial [Longimicrobiales bacterium]|nr:hypothetical protein [Longimicrobiales bacterium]
MIRIPRKPSTVVLTAALVGLAGAIGVAPPVRAAWLGAPERPAAADAPGAGPVQTTPTEAGQGA